MSLRVAIAGAGMVSRHHLIGWSRRSDVEVVAIADPSEESRSRRAAEFSIGACFGDVAAMLEAVAVDALDIATPVGTHGDLVRLAASRGIRAVLCQKPLSADLAEAAAIAGSVAGTATRLMVHENWRFRPHYRRIAEWLGSGLIGTPRCFRMETLSAAMLSQSSQRPPGLARQPFLAGMERLIVLELLVHHLDTLQFLLGPMAVKGAALTRISGHVRGEDTAAILLASQEAFGTLDGSMAVHGAPARASDGLDIQGERGRILLEGDRLHLFGEAPRTVAIDLAADYQASYDGAIAHFVGAVLGDKPFETAPEVHLHVLEQVETIYRMAGRAG